MQTTKRLPNWWKAEIQKFKEFNELKHKKQNYTKLLRLVKTNDNSKNNIIYKETNIRIIKSFLMQVKRH